MAHPAKHAFTAGSLFAGMGGFCLAFRQEGFRVLWANEKDAWAAKTYRHNFRETVLHEKPIEDLSVIADSLEPVDVLTAGFPCQPFSVAGTKSGFADERGQAFFEMMRLIREWGSERPKILLFENVPHLRKHDQGRSFLEIAQEIQAADYWFDPRRHWAVLNTRRHTNIPQNRERLYMAALSQDHFGWNGFQFPSPEPETREAREYLDLQSAADPYFYFQEDSRYRGKFESSIKNGDPEAVYMLRRNYIRENKTNSVPALLANMGDGGHNTPVIRDDWGIRKFTPKECLRLQGFADEEFSFPDNISRVQQYKQIGNAVTVPLVRRLAGECRRLLEDR